jgi:hypothetical protein
MSVEQELLEAEEVLKILEVYCSDRASVEAGLALGGLKVLLRASRERVENASRELSTRAVDSRTAKSNKSLASRIQRLPEGELRSVELDLDPFEEFAPVARESGKSGV